MIGLVERKVGFKFYKKPMSFNLVTPTDLHRLLMGELVEDFCEPLRASGYPHRVAARIVTNGLKNYCRKVEAAKKAGKMFHRPEWDGRIERRLGKLSGKTNWFKPRKGSKSITGVEKEQGLTMP